MDEIYELVKAGKARQGINSDRGFALANDMHPQVIADLKAGKCMPNAENMLKILAAAGKDVNDGIKAIKRQKEAGFANVGIVAGMSLAGVTSVFISHGFIDLATVFAACYTLCETDDLEQCELDGLSAANDEVFDSGLRAVV